MDKNYFEDQNQYKTDENLIKRNPCYYIRTVELSEKNCTLAVSLNFQALKCIPKSLHTEKLCLVAIKQCGYALKFVSKKIITEELCFEAVRMGSVSSIYLPRGYNVFEYIPCKYLTQEFYIKAYSINPKILCYIPKEIHASLNIVKTYNNINPLLPTIENIANDGLCIRNMTIKSITEDMCKVAVENNGMALQFVPDEWRTLQLCELAVEQNLLSMAFVPTEILTLGIVKKWLYKVVSCFGNMIYEDSKNSESRVFTYMDSPRMQELKRIMTEFPDDINSDYKVMQIQRKLGFRRFISKTYDKESGQFITSEKILSRYGLEEKRFSEFMEFYSYVDYDLRDSNLSDYNFVGVDFNKINITGAYISSDVLIEQNLYDDTYYNSIMPKDRNMITPSWALENENIDAQSLLRIDDIESNELNYNNTRFYYISDIHLMHKIKNKFQVHATEREVLEYIRAIVDSIEKSACGISAFDYILIGGDISYDFEISRLFYTELSQKFRYNKIIVILGNHELWDARINKRSKKLSYSNRSIDEVIEKYRNMLGQLNIYFLNNQMLAKENNQVIIFGEEQLLSMSEQRLKNIALKSPYLLLAGLGFSGYNKEFNATCGIYRNKIFGLEEDLQETQKFEKVYLKLKKCLQDEKLIVFTHTPKSDWSIDGYNKNWIYVNGHTHKNEYVIDDEKTVYADNQIGYKSVSFGLKAFRMSNTYDIFRYYDDGKYIIDRVQYIELNRGMKIQCVCNRINGSIHMLKKHNNYCFFYEENDKIYLMNGGAIRKVDNQDLDYYFDRMDVYSDAIKSMLHKYNLALKQISKEVKIIGGSGDIHGCIVDIDFFNHIYLNPIDGSITSYFATDITNKKVYSSVLALLKENTPRLYDQYLLAQNDNLIIGKNQLINNIDLEMTKYVFDTSMYEPSRVMRSLQYITEANIIRNWNDDVIDKICDKLSNGGLCIE
ncbi:MAG: metallophosphoesterase [Bacillota bacterium]